MKRKTNRHAIYWEPEAGSFNIRKHSKVRQSNRLSVYVKGAKAHTIAQFKVEILISCLQLNNL